MDQVREEPPAHFSVFGIPVRVGASFWVMTFLFGLQGRNVSHAALWVGVCFVSVLLHELGHALAARYFGARTSIVLHGFGGETHHSVLTRGQSLLVSLAGPFAGFALGAAVLVVSSFLPEPSLVAQLLLVVNIGWGIMNLLPVLPFDGGQVLAAILGPKRVLLSSIISALTGAAVAIASWFLLPHRSLWITFLFGMASAAAIERARMAWWQRRDEREKLPEQLQSARVALGKGELDDAMLLADDVIRRASTRPLRNSALNVLAWVYVTRGDGNTARDILARIEPRYAVDPYTLAAVEDAAGQSRRAMELLVEARRHGVRGPEATRLLIDLYVREGRWHDAAEVAAQDVDLLPIADARAVVGALIEAGLHREAARLSARLFEVYTQATDAIEQARALALVGDIAGALAALAHALASGPIDLDQLRTDGAFAPVVHDERFGRLLASATK